MVDNDISFIHGTTIALHNIVASVRKMKNLYANEATPVRLTPENAANLCLSAPPVVLRQATSNGEAGGCPFSKYSLLLLKLGKASADSDAKDLIFMTSSWSRCPAESWVPAILAGIWKRACTISK